MRNLKKLLAVVLTVVMIASMMVPALAANTYEAEALQLQAIKVFAGGPEDLKLDESVTRIQGLTFAIRAAGKDAEALAMETAEVDAILADWTDAASIPAWGRAYAAYAIKNNITVGLSATSKVFGAMQIISGRSLLVFIMKAGMGYADVTTANVIEASVEAGILTAGQAATFGAKEALVRDDAAGILFGAFATGVNADGSSLLDAYIASGATTAADAAAAGFVSSATLAVESIAANTAKSFLVKFNKAVTDDDKVTFSVKRLSSDVAVTATWNEAKTEATIASASNLAEATFSVAVLKDGAEIAKEDIAITAQKVAKIEFTSTSVAVKLDGNKEGYVTYKVYDQYNNDITGSYLANNMTFQCGAVSGAGSSVIGKNGVITITPAPGGTQLLQFPQISVIAYDTNSGISATATLPTSSAVGTLSEFALGSADNLKLVEGDVTTVFYLPYTAKDVSGNETKDYDLVKGGMIFNPTTSTNLIVSLPAYVQAQVVQDPADARFAAIEVRVLNNATPLTMDMPITITAMTYGKASSVQTTLVKSKVLDSIVLLAPSETVATNESPEIKFEAYDQFGNKITKYSDINGKISVAGLTLDKKVNGDAKFIMTALTTKGVQSISAVVTRTGKMSTLNINVQDAAKPARLVLNNADIIYAMENGATQNIVINDDSDAELYVYDQYDRKMSDSKVTAALGAATYTIDVTSVTTDVAIGTAQFTNIGTETLTANNAAGGNGTVKFELKDVANSKVLSTVSLSIAVIKTSDISNYTISTFDKPIYASITAANTAQEQAYAAEIKVYGQTGSGAKVLLAGTPVMGTDVENTGDFNVLAGTGAWNAVKITADAITDDRATAETLATVTLWHNGAVNALTTTITSSKTAPVVTDIVSKGTDEDKITLTAAQFTALLNKDVVKFDSTGAAGTLADFYFEVKDSYEKKAMIPTQFKVDVKNAAETGAGTATLTISATGEITGRSAVAGDHVYVTAVTNNGMVKTVKITIAP